MKKTDNLGVDVILDLQNKVSGFRGSKITEVAYDANDKANVEFSP